MITKLYKKFIDKIIGEEQTPLHVFGMDIRYTINPGNG